MSLVRTFVWGEDAEYGESGFIPGWIKGANLVAAGFGAAHDVLEHLPNTPGGFEGEMMAFGAMYHVRCENCDALVINGTPAHETGCPSAMHECAGCNEVIPQRHRYCESCGS